MKTEEEVQGILREAGVALFGTRWKVELAEALGLRDHRRINQWMARKGTAAARPVPPWIWPKIVDLLRSRAAAQLALADQLFSEISS